MTDSKGKVAKSVDGTLSCIPLRMAFVGVIYLMGTHGFLPTSHVSLWGPFACLGFPIHKKSSTGP